MNKLLKILFAIEFILIVVIVILGSIGNKKIPTAYAVMENKDTETIDFKMFTKAVCEEKSERIFCSDKLFARCNGTEYEIGNNTENLTNCGNLKLNLSDTKATGHVVLNQEWKDPRK